MVLPRERVFIITACNFDAVEAFFWRNVGKLRTGPWHLPHEPGSKLLVLGMVIQPLVGNPYNGYINPYYWVDDRENCWDII